MIQELHHALHLYNPITGKKETYETLFQQDPEKWGTSMANQLGRIAQVFGTRMPTGNNNIYYIRRNQVHMVGL